MRVLALDLAIGTTGWCVLEVVSDPFSSPAVLLGHGTFTLPSRRRNEPLAGWLRRRYAAMRGEVWQLVSDYAEITLVAYEYPDKSKSVWSGGSKGREFHAVQGLSRAEGFLIAAMEGRELRAVSTSEAKYAATGMRDAQKERVRLDLSHLWIEVVDMSEDAVDALAVGLAAMKDPTGEQWTKMDKLVKKTPRATRFGVRSLVRGRRRVA